MHLSRTTLGFRKATTPISSSTKLDKLQSPRFSQRSRLWRARTLSSSSLATPSSWVQSSDRASLGNSGWGGATSNVSLRCRSIAVRRGAEHRAFFLVFSHRVRCTDCIPFQVHQTRQELQVARGDPALPEPAVLRRRAGGVRRARDDQPVHWVASARIASIPCCVPRYLGD